MAGEDAGATHDEWPRTLGRRVAAQRLKPHASTLRSASGTKDLASCVPTGNSANGGEEGGFDAGARFCYVAVSFSFGVKREASCGERREFLARQS